MPITQRGQSAAKSYSGIRTVDFSKLGQEDAVKANADVLFVPLFQYNFDERNAATLSGTEINDTLFDIFNFPFYVPGDDGKPRFTSIRWADSGLRKDEGDTHDDPGYEMSLTEKPEKLRNTQGFNGAPDGDKSSWGTYTTTYSMPVIWDVKQNEEGEVEVGSGELVWLEMNAVNWQKLQDFMVKTLGKTTKRKFSHSADKKSRTYDAAGRGYAFTLHKRPKAKSYSEIYTFSCSMVVCGKEDISRFDSQVEVEYPQFIEALERRYRIHSNIINAFNVELITEEAAAAQIHSVLASRVLVAIGEIAEGCSDSEVETAWAKTLPSINQLAPVASLKDAIIQKKEVNVGDGPVKDEIPF